MILVDTSVWVDHLRARDDVLASLLEAGSVVVHPFVTGELALGHLKRRDAVLQTLQDLPQARVATHDEVLHFIGQNRLFGLGIGYVDAHLLAAARLNPGVSLWTRDRRLHRPATLLGLTAKQLN